MSFASTTKKIIHTISNLSKFNINCTPEILIHGIPWYVQFEKECFEEEEWLGFYLFCKNENESSDWLHTAFVKVTLLPFDKNVNPFEYRNRPNVFSCSENGYGRGKFINWKRLITVRNGFVRDDTIRFEIKIEVADPNDENTSTLNFDVLDKCCGNGSNAVFRLTVSKIDALMAVATPKFMLRGLYWKITIYNDGAKWLGIEVEMIEDENSDLKCKVTATIKLISEKDDAKSIEWTSKKIMNGQNVMETSGFVSWHDLFDDLNGFIFNNAIILEIELTAKQSIYGDQKGKKRQTTCDRSECAKLLKLECSICMEDIRDQEVSSLTCTHLFCTKCIKNVVRNRRKCPVCNAAAKLADLRRIRLPM